uniref:Uncharacterized protein n=1 Tax=Nelumbo nucifera TaxID=4432 RepID=A0A822YG58_NELNU|nr:TPA_asm: hypothetical protein HUJ06_012015 [Nelumbo nucifera]
MDLRESPPFSSFYWFLPSASDTTSRWCSLLPMNLTVLIATDVGVLIPKISRWGIGTRRVIFHDGGSTRALYDRWREIIAALHANASSVQNLMAARN